MCPSILSCGSGLLQGATGSPHPPPRAPLMGFRPLQHRRYRGYSSRLHARGSPTCTVSTVCAGLLPRRLPGPISSRERSWGCPGAGFPSTPPPPARHRRQIAPSPFTSREGLARAPAVPAHRLLPRVLPSVGDEACRPSLLRLSPRRSLASPSPRCAPESASPSVVAFSLESAIPFRGPSPPTAASSASASAWLVVVPPDEKDHSPAPRSPQARRKLSTIGPPPYSSRDSPACGPARLIPIFFTPVFTACG
jgi:hypothetical protein